MSSLHPSKIKGLSYRDSLVAGYTSDLRAVSFKLIGLAFPYTASFGMLNPPYFISSPPLYLIQDKILQVYTRWCRVTLRGGYIGGDNINHKLLGCGVFGLCISEAIRGIITISTITAALRNIDHLRAGGRRTVNP